MAITESELSALLAALKAGEITVTIRTSVEWILQQLIEAEATAVIGARLHERTNTRATQQRAPSPAAVDDGGGCRVEDLEAAARELLPFAVGAAPA